jgi:hypothetical protein
VRSANTLGDTDLRRALPRFEEENLEADLALLRRIERIAGGRTSPQDAGVER